MKKTTTIESAFARLGTEVSGRLHKFVMRFFCFAGRHDRVYWSEEECDEKNVVGGVWRPFKCSRCGFESQIFKWPRE